MLDIFNSQTEENKTVFRFESDNDDSNSSYLCASGSFLYERDGCVIRIGIHELSVFSHEKYLNISKGKSENLIYSNFNGQVTISSDGEMVTFCVCNAVSVRGGDITVCLPVYIAKKAFKDVAVLVEKYSHMELNTEDNSDDEDIKDSTNSKVNDEDFERILDSVNESMNDDEIVNIENCDW